MRKPLTLEQINKQLDDTNDRIRFLAGNNPVAKIDRELTFLRQRRQDLMHLKGYELVTLYKKQLTPT